MGRRNPLGVRRQRSRVRRNRRGRARAYASPRPHLHYLRENEEKYRQIFQNAKDAIYLFELDARGLPGRILEVNDEACRRLGYTREEYLDRKSVV